MACSLRRRRWRSSSPPRSGSVSSSCSGSITDFTDRADQIALRDRNVGKVHAPARKEHAEDTDLAADAVGALVARSMIGADREIATRPVVDAFGGDQPFGA